MICPKCGADLPENINFCTECGMRLSPSEKSADVKNSKQAGYSPRINDPAFARYIHHSRVWSFTFAGILAVIVIAGFYIYGATSAEMDNPEALYIGLLVGGMFILIAVGQTIGRHRSTAWDGVVVDKKAEKNDAGENTVMKLIGRIIGCIR